MKEFDEDMEVKKEEQDAINKNEKAKDNEDIGIFGVEIKNLKGSVVYLYVGLVVAALAGAFIWGFRQIDNSSPQTRKKRRPKSGTK
jgi:hypothetical protein